MGPVLLISLRLSISSAFLLALGYGLKLHQRLRRADWKLVFMLALFNPFLYFIGENFGVQYVTPTMAAVMIATIPLFTPLAAFLFFGERLSWASYVGIVTSVLGVVLVIDLRAQNFDGSLQSDTTIGIAYLLLAVAAAVVYTLLIRKMAGRYNALSITVFQNVIGLVLFVLLWLFTERTEFASIEWTNELWWPLLGLSVLCSSLAFVFFAYGIQHLGPSLANSFSNIIPVFTAIFSFFFLSEKLGYLQLIGILLVVFGLFISQLKPTKRSQTIL